MISPDCKLGHICPYLTYATPHSNNKQMQLHAPLSWGGFFFLKPQKFTHFNFPYRSPLALSHPSVLHLAWSDSSLDWGVPLCLSSACGTGIFPAGETRNWWSKNLILAFQNGGEGDVRCLLQNPQKLPLYISSCEKSGLQHFDLPCSCRLH